MILKFAVLMNGVAVNLRDVYETKIIYRNWFDVCNLNKERMQKNTKQKYNIIFRKRLIIIILFFTSFLKHLLLQVSMEVLLELPLKVGVFQFVEYLSQMQSYSSELR